MKKYFLFLSILFLFSCSSNKNFCLYSDKFDIIVNSNSLNKINTKIIYNKLINESTISFNSDSNYLLNINIDASQRTSLISQNNVIEALNVKFIVNYQIINKTDKKEITSGNFIIIENLEISDERFANYINEEYIIKNFINNFLYKMENAVLRISKNKCKL